MRIESSITSLTWIPSEAIEGMPKLPFVLGVAHYDDPPPQRIENLDKLHGADAFREANELRAWIEVDGGKITDYGQEGRGLIGVDAVQARAREDGVPGGEVPAHPARAGGGRGLGALRPDGRRPHRPSRAAPRPRQAVLPDRRPPPHGRRLQLILYADGQADGSLIGASPFPRHWLYDAQGELVEKSGTIDFEKWYRESYGEQHAVGRRGHAGVRDGRRVGARARSLAGGHGAAAARCRAGRVQQGETLVEQGEAGDELFLLLDGVLDVEVDGETVGQVGPGALLGERAALESGERTATLRAVTACRLVVLEAAQISRYELERLAASRQPL